MRTLEELRQAAIEMLENDDDLLVDMVNELDSWNGYADGFRAFPMYELDDLFCDCKLSDFLNKITSSFNLQDEYFVDTIYGLDSTDDIARLYRDNVYESDLLDEIIENASNIYFNDGDFEELIDSIINYDESELDDVA